MKNGKNIFSVLYDYFCVCRNYFNARISYLGLLFHAFRHYWAIFLVVGGLVFALLPIKSALATTHYYNPSGSSNWHNIDTGNFQGQIWNLMTIANITDITIGYYTAIAGSRTTNLVVYDLNGNLMASTSVVWTPTTDQNLTKNFIFNTGILDTGYYYLGIRNTAGSAVGWRYGAYSTGVGCWYLYNGSGNISYCENGQSQQLTISGTAGGSNVVINFPTESLITPAFTSFFVDYMGSSDSRYMTLEVNTAKATTTNFSDCSAYSYSDVCYRSSIIKETNVLVDDYEINAPVSWYVKNNIYYTQAILIADGVEIASSTSVSYFINASSSVNNSAITYTPIPVLTATSSFLETCASLSEGGFFSSSTIRQIGCILFAPSNGLNFIQTQYENFKTIFPFNIIFGTFSTIQSKAQNYQTNYQNIEIPMGFDPSFMANTSIVLTSSTIPDIIGSSSWDTIKTLEEYLIWLGLGVAMIITIL